MLVKALQAIHFLNKKAPRLYWFLSINYGIRCWWITWILDYPEKKLWAAYCKYALTPKIHTPPELRKHRLESGTCHQDCWCWTAEKWLTKV